MTGSAKTRQWMGLKRRSTLSVSLCALFAYDVEEVPDDRRPAELRRDHQRGGAGSRLAHVEPGACGRDKKRSETLGNTLMDAIAKERAEQTTQAPPRKRSERQRKTACVVDYRSDERHCFGKKPAFPCGAAVWQGMGPNRRSTLSNPPTCHLFGRALTGVCQQRQDLLVRVPAGDCGGTKAAPGWHAAPGSRTETETETETEIETETEKDKEKENTKGKEKDTKDEDEDDKENKGNKDDKDNKDNQDKDKDKDKDDKDKNKKKEQQQEQQGQQEQERE